MILSPTPPLEGRPTREYLCIVTAESIYGTNVVRDIMAGWKNLVGGRSKAYEDVLQETRDKAYSELEARAAALGADAVVGIGAEISSFGDGSMFVLILTGTAVKL